MSTRFDGELYIVIVTTGSTTFDHTDTLAGLMKPGDTMIKKVEGAYIARNRTQGVSEFLKSNRKYLLFIDHDLIFPRTDTIMRLLNDDKDIVSGLYFNRSQPYLPFLLYKNKGTYEYHYDRSSYPKGLVEVDACPAGLLLIKRCVLERMDVPWFDSLHRYVDGNWQFIGEDIYFCEKAAKLGFKIMVDTEAAALHLAQIAIGPEGLMVEWEQRKRDTSK